MGSFLDTSFGKLGSEGSLRAAPATQQNEGAYKMRYVLAIWVIIVLVFLFFFSLFSLAESGVSSLVLAGLSGLGLYRIFKFMYSGYNSPAQQESRRKGAGEACGSGGATGVPSDPLEFIIFYDMTSEDDWEDY